MSSTKLVFGCGYLGLRVASRWLSDGATVFAVTRSDARAQLLQEHGIVPLIGDVTELGSLRELPNARIVLFAVSFDRQSKNSLEDVLVNGLKNVLQAVQTTVERFIYISTTGVYDQCDGSWVDENSPTEPIRASAKAHLAAEQVLAADPVGVRSVVLRLAGIYGPNRVPRLAELNAGLPFASHDDGFLNLIHIDDACTAVIAAEELADTPDLFVISDGHPVVRRDFYEFAAQLQGISVNWQASSWPVVRTGHASRRDTDKRCRNQRMLDRLRFELRYPSYRQGLAEILRSG